MYNSAFKGDVCSHRISFFLDNFIRRLFQDPRKIVGPYISSGDTVLDLGCGPGFFSLEMAKMVGEGGRMIAVDLQKEMLAKVGAKAEAENLSHVIRLHQCHSTDLALDPAVSADFILAFYMVHETPDFNAFFAQAAPHLAPGGRFLVVEPPFHVSGARFEEIAGAAEENGLSIADRPRGKGGKSLLLARG
ncbi:MAG: class I SAM-dependent methyltransferase [Desulfobacter sp.]|nr:MAG: class I SAM-dependent methyltransferase [Desulfobacter sp.]